MPMSTPQMPSQTIMASMQPSLANPGAAVQTPAGLMGQNVQIAPNSTSRPVSIPEQVMFEAMMRKMQG